MLTKQQWCFTHRKHIQLLCLSLLLLPAGLLAQKGKLVNPVIESKWQLDATVSGVQFYHRVSVCDGKSVVFLKFNNTNKRPLTISWNESFDANENNQSAKLGSYGKKQLILSAGITEATSCDGENENRLIARPQQTSPVNSVQIKNFSFTEIKVEK